MKRKIPVIYAGIRVGAYSKKSFVFVKLSKDGIPDIEDTFNFSKIRQDLYIIGEGYLLEPIDDSYSFPRLGLTQMDNDKYTVSKELIDGWILKTEICEGYFRRKAMSKKLQISDTLSQLQPLHKVYKKSGKSGRASLIAAIIYFLETGKGDSQ